MGKSTSKKPGKGTNYYVNHFLTSKSAWFLQNPPPLRIYPGALIPVDLDEIEFVADTIMQPRVLPPGVPLDDDILEGILQHLYWWEHEKAYAVYQLTESALDKLYMEALWRQIQKQKKK